MLKNLLNKKFCIPIKLLIDQISIFFRNFDFIFFMNIKICQSFFFLLKEWLPKNKTKREKMKRTKRRKLIKQAENFWIKGNLNE